MCIRLLILLVVVSVCHAFRIAHIEPIHRFSTSFLSKAPPSAPTTRNIFDEFARQAATSITPKDRVRVRFTAFDNEEFDLTLDLDTKIAHKARIFAGVPGNEQEVSFQPSTYSTVITNDDDTTTLATFTVFPDGKMDGLVVRDGVAYMVTPVSFLEADVSNTEPSAEARALEFARLNTLKATSASGMVVYRLSDVKTHDELGNALYGCKAMRAPTDAFHEDHSGVDHHDDGHVDYASPNMPLISEVAAATAIPGALDAFGRINTQTIKSLDDNSTVRPNGQSTSSDTGRKPLLKRWTDCHTSAAGNGKIVYLDLVVDIGAAVTLTPSPPTVDVAYVSHRLASITGQLNVFFQTQVASRLSLNTIVIRTGPSSETWNVYYPGHPDWATKNVTYQQYFDAAAAYRKSQLLTTKGATQQFITVAFSSGVVGLAYVGVLCGKDYSMGFSSYAGGGILTLAHELGHNFGASHTFDTCAGKYTDKTGGIMDYSNGILGPESDSQGEMGFHSVCSKGEMCSHLQNVYAGKSISIVATQCFANYDGNAVCGDGVVEGDEECDIYGGDTACCVKCKFVTGATCAHPGPCCVNCKIQNSSTACGTNGHCGIDGSCQNTACKKYSNTAFCELPSTTNPCREKCTINGGACGGTTITFSNALCAVNGGDGICNSGTCNPITYDWDVEAKTCACDSDEKPNEQRAVRCKSSDGRFVSSSYCDPDKKPTTTVYCCDYRWATTEYSICSTTCGDGTQTRVATCENYSRNNVTVSSSLCESSTKPALSQPCSSTLTCDAYWKCLPTASGDYSTASECAGDDDVGYGLCTVNCSTASQTRVPKCWSRAGAMVVADAQCLTTKPAASRTCVASTMISNVALSASTITAGMALKVNWCFHGEAQQVKLSFLTSTNTYIGLVVVAAQDQTVTFNLPYNSNSNANIRIVAADGASATSSTFNVTSRCGSVNCGANGVCNDSLGTCQCSAGWTGDTCAISPCTNAACLNGATCQNTDSNGIAAGTCQCAAGYSGTRCEYVDACDASRCQHGGWVTATQSTCATTCSCKSPWQGDTCGVCPLTCQNNGRPTNACDGCICAPGYGSDGCICRVALTTLTYPRSAPADEFAPVLLDDLVTLTGLPVDNLEVVDVSATEPMNVIVALRFCSAAYTTAAVSSMTDLYLAWSASLRLIDSGSSILQVGDSASLAGSVSSAGQLYDPLCTGASCPTGSNPYPPAPSSSDSNTGMIIGIVVGCGIALILAGAAYLYCQKRSKKAAPPVEQQQRAPTVIKPETTMYLSGFAAPIPPQVPPGHPSYAPAHAPAPYPQQPIYSAPAQRMAPPVPPPSQQVQTLPQYPYKPHGGASQPPPMPARHPNPPQQPQQQQPQPYTANPAFQSSVPAYPQYSYAAQAPQAPQPPQPPMPSLAPAQLVIPQGNARMPPPPPRK